VIEHRFGQSSPFSVGVEEELFVVDPRTMHPVAAPQSLFEGEQLKRELFASVVEVTTGVCASVPDAADELRRLRANLRARAEAEGLAVAAGGTWPTAVSEEQEITPDPGYLRFVEYAGSSAKRQYCAGLHVHVGVAGPDECIAALERVLPWLPVLLAVSANSPYAAGRETGLASTRAEILALLPRSAAPPVFARYADWERFAERLVELGLADAITRIWWDVRPHPRWGTLELRMPDQPSGLEATVAFAALFQALVASGFGERPEAADRGVYAQNRWAALRFGRAAQLIHPENGRLDTVPDLLAELVERVAPAADELGSRGLVAPLATLDGAEAQLELGRRDGLRAVCERLVALA
jgi:glutamate---cysteine ligase / carboxylate-amine ligase